MQINFMYLKEKFMYLIRFVILCYRHFILDTLNSRASFNNVITFLAGGLCFRVLLED